MIQRDGFTSVFSINPSNGHLELREKSQGHSGVWVTQDLSARYGVPAATGRPAAQANDGVVRVYTVRAADGHLQETYQLPGGGPWATYDMTAVYRTPAVAGSPTVVFHDGVVSVYTVSAAGGQLHESYHIPGQPWIVQNLTGPTGIPAAAPSPTALFHDGVVSVFTVSAAGGRLHEAYLAPGRGVWVGQNLSALTGTPSAAGSPAAVRQPSGPMSVFTVNAADGHLYEAILGGGAGWTWTGQDVSARHGTPPAAGAPTVVANGAVTSVFTVNLAGGHLQESYVEAGQPWRTRDVTPDRAPSTVTGSPAATAYPGYLGAFAVDTTGRVHETYRAAGAAFKTRTVDATAGCTPGMDHDYNGDGVRDVAIADPEAAVDGATGAGLIRVAYGGGKPVQTLTQATIGVSAGADAGDRFGHSLASYDINGDGCGDLVVGAPYRDVNGLSDAGVVYVLLGAPAGLATGWASLTWRQGRFYFPGDAPEAGDAFGYSVAAGHTAGGPGWAVVGVPGEDVGTLVDAGMVHYLSGAVNAGMWFGSGVPGATPVEDRFGYSVTGNEHHLVVGAPGRTVGGNVFAGTAYIYTHQIVDGRPRLLGAADQNNSGEQAEANDNFAKSVSVVAYRPAGVAAGQPDSLLAIGVPGEDLPGASDAGLVHQYRLDANGAIPLSRITQADGGPQDAVEEGDGFGERVRVANTQPGQVSTDRNVLVAVGSPGEDVEPTNGDRVTDAGSVRVFGATAPGAWSTRVGRGTAGLPGKAIDRELIGFAMGASPEHLLVAGPYGAGEVNAIAWADLAAGRATVARSWQPGSGGIPAGEVAFGAAIG
ncbi:MAG TPA: hypothetical protein VF755_09420 [Catenuloplanes sp.]